MMPEKYDNELSGALFTNFKKETDNQPDYNGSCTINGVEYWISGWIKKPKAGGKNFLSLAFKIKQEIVARADAPAKHSVRSAEQYVPSFGDDDIPF
jgi:hypothetical protein